MMSEEAAKAEMRWLAEAALGYTCKTLQGMPEAIREVGRLVIRAKAHKEILKPGEAAVSLITAGIALLLMSAPDRKAAAEVIEKMTAPLLAVLKGEPCSDSSS